MPADVHAGQVQDHEDDEQRDRDRCDRDYPAGPRLRTIGGLGVGWSVRTVGWCGHGGVPSVSSSAHASLFGDTLSTFGDDVFGVSGA